MSDRADLDKCAALRLLLADGGWHDGRAMRAVGGDRYGARVDEIRYGKDGDLPMAVDCTVEANVSAWRMRAWKPAEQAAAEARKQARVATRARVKQLEARVAELEAELEKLKTEKTAASPRQHSFFDNHLEG